MTEDEAKTKWCPFAPARVVQYVDSTQTLRQEAMMADDRISLGCIASACMAWRWKYAHEPSGRQIFVEGYCGLAGKPE